MTINYFWLITDQINKQQFDEWTNFWDEKCEKNSGFVKKKVNQQVFWQLFTKCPFFFVFLHFFENCFLTCTLVARVNNSRRGLPSGIRTRSGLGKGIVIGNSTGCSLYRCRCRNRQRTGRSCWHEICVYARSCRCNRTVRVLNVL